MEFEGGGMPCQGPCQGGPTRKASAPGQAVTPIIKVSQCWSSFGCPVVWDTLVGTGERHFGIIQELLWNIWGKHDKCDTGKSTSVL